MSLSLQQFARYDVYKDSGMEWVKQIPAHWSRHRLGDLCDFEQGKAHEPFIDDQGIHICVNSRFVSTRGETVKYSTRNLTPAKKNDILMVMSDLPNGRALAKAYLVKDDKKYAVNQRVCRLTAKKAYFTYLYYLLDRHPDLLKNNDGSNQTHLTNANYLKLCVYLPPLTEQTAIATFLDQKTAQIDQAIALKQKQIELFKERKQLVIQQAVTKGLNPNALMRDSGVEWIGEIPEHWDVKRIKRLGRIINGYAFSSQAFVSHGVRVMKISNIQTMNIDWTDESFVDVFHVRKFSQFLVKKGDLVFALTRPIISTGIKAAIVDSEESILLNQRNAVLRPFKMVLKKWLYYMILNNNFIQTFEREIDITGQQPNISTTSIGNLNVPLPSVDEQTAIVAHIETQSAKIDKAIDIQQQQINKLKEYKATLINSAVTGKIKVC